MPCDKRKTVVFGMGDNTTLVGLREDPTQPSTLWGPFPNQLKWYCHPYEILTLFCYFAIHETELSQSEQ